MATVAAIEEAIRLNLWKHQIRLTIGLIKHNQESTLTNDDDLPNSSLTGSDHKNILLSPHLLVCTLASLLSGTESDTRVQLARTLLCHKSGRIMENMTNDYVSAHCGHNKEMLKQNKSSLRVDTFLYRNPSFPIQHRQEKLWKKYQCIAKELPLMNDDEKPSLNALTTINQDFLDSDSDKIPILSTVDYVTLVNGSIHTVLVNSVYFKTAWSNEFELQYGQFRKSNGETVKTEFLYKKKIFRYYDDRESMSRAIEIKFCNNGSASMILILPDENISLHHYVKHLLNYDVLKRILKNLTTRFEVQLTLPKFGLKTKANMVKPLQMLRSFAPKDKVNETIKSLDDQIVLVQRLSIEIDEKGEDSKQQTGLMSKLKKISHKEAELKADRPFLFLIMTNGDHKQILFAGLCNDPMQECV